MKVEYDFSKGNRVDDSWRAQKATQLKGCNREAPAILQMKRCALSGVDGHKGANVVVLPRLQSQDHVFDSLKSGK